MKGDGFQNGGTLIVDKNGKQLYEDRQEDAAEHISEEEILKALGLTKEPKQLEIKNKNTRKQSSNKIFNFMFLN